MNIQTGTLQTTVMKKGGTYSLPSTTITWVAIDDSRTCPICKAINGYQWTFTANQGIPNELTHPQYGVVWNNTVGSQAHGHQRFNCRCSITPTIDVSDIKEKIEQMKTDIERVHSEQLK